MSKLSNAFGFYKFNNSIDGAKVSKKPVVNHKAVHHLLFDRKAWVTEQLTAIGQKYHDPAERLAHLSAFKKLHAPLEG